MTKKTDYYQANQGFSTVLDGENVWVAKGEYVHAKHPLLKGRSELFDPVEDFGRFDRPEVEQATAAPGEKRGAGSPRKRSPRKTKATVPKSHFGLLTSDVKPADPKS